MSAPFKLVCLATALMCAGCPQQHTPPPFAVQCAVADSVAVFNAEDESPANIPVYPVAGPDGRLVIVYSTSMPEPGLRLIGVHPDGEPTGVSSFIAASGKGLVLPTPEGYALYFYRDGVCFEQVVSGELQPVGEPVEHPEMPENCGVLLWGTTDARLQLRTEEGQRTLMLTKGSDTQTFAVPGPVFHVTAESPDTFHVTLGVEQQFKLWRVHPGGVEETASTVVPDMIGRWAPVGTHGYLNATRQGNGSEEGVLLQFIGPPEPVVAHRLPAGYTTGAGLLPYARRPTPRGGAAVAEIRNSDDDERTIVVGVALDGEYGAVTLGPFDYERRIGPGIAAVADDSYLVTYEESGVLRAAQVTCHLR